MMPTRYFEKYPDDIVSQYYTDLAVIS